MGKKILVSIFLIALLVSLFFNFQNKEEKQVSQDTKKQVSFEQKQKCAVYRKEFEAKFEKNNNREGSFTTYKNLDKVFYSPKLQSCLVLYSESVLQLKYKGLYLDDALTGENVLGTMISRDDEDGVKIKLENDFNASVKQYE